MRAHSSRIYFRLAAGLALFHGCRCHHLKVERPALLAYIVAIPWRDFHADIAFDEDSLTTETRGQLEIRRQFEPVELVIFGNREILRAVSDPNVTCCACTHPTTCVFQLYARIESNVQNRGGLTVTRIRKCRWIEFDGIVLIQKRDFRHISERPANLSYCNAADTRTDPVE